MKILVVDHQRTARRVIRHILSSLQGVTMLEAGSLTEGQAQLEDDDVHLVIADMRLSTNIWDRGGLELLRWMRQTERQAPVVMVISSTEVGEMREAMRLGAHDYMLKDELSPRLLLPIVESVRERLNLKGELARLRRRVDRKWGTAALIGDSAAMARIRRLIERVANADAPILIRGETGSGKELVARAIHEMGKRAGEPFLAVNCSALPGTLIESLVFGHERGAFTGATRRARGQLELAGSGTLLLDEIAEMPRELQAKLLRALEERRFRPLGSEEEKPLKARVLAATHVDLDRHIAEGRFREDLYYRLNVVPIDVPPLRDRIDDLPALLATFVEDAQRKLRFDQTAVQWLQGRDWPGNVRELRNTVERLTLLSETENITVASLQELVSTETRQTSVEVNKLAHTILALPPGIGSKLDMVERAVLEHALSICGGNKSAAARLIGIDRKALERRWDRLGEQAVALAPEEA